MTTMILAGVRLRRRPPWPKRNLGMLPWQLPPPPTIDENSHDLRQQQAVVVTSTSPAAPSSEICTFPYHSTCNCQPPGLMETRLVPAQQLTIVAMSVLTVEKNSQRRPNWSDINWFILEKNLFPAKFVAKVLLSWLIWRITWGSPTDQPSQWTRTIRPPFCNRTIIRPHFYDRRNRPHRLLLLHKSDDFTFKNHTYTQTRRTNII